MPTFGRVPLSIVSIAAGRPHPVSNLWEYPMPDARSDALLDDLVHAPGPLVASLILPTDRLRAGNRGDATRLRLTVERVIDRLDGLDGLDDCADSVARHLRMAAGGVDLHHPGTGVMLFAGPTWHRTTHVDYPVDEQVTIGERPALRALAIGVAAAPRYRVLVLAEHGAHLFEGRTDRLHEIHGDGFPFTADITPVSDPRHSDLAIPDSWYRELRANLRTIDALTSPMFTEDPTPVVVAASRRVRAEYRAITHHADLIAGEIGGWPDTTAVAHLGAAVAPVAGRVVHTHRLALVDELDQAIGARRAVLGIDSVIASALDGAGRLLLVEDGYSAFGTVRPSGGVEVHDRADAFDLVEFAVATVLDKGGSVEGVGRNELGGDAGLGLLLRY